MLQSNEVRAPRLATIPFLFFLLFFIQLDLNGNMALGQSFSDLREMARSRELGLEGDPGTALEHPVDRSAYELVPGDVVLVGVWGPRPETFQTTVTPDGHLLIPDLLGIPAAGLTLEEAEEDVTRELRRLYPRESIRLHLLRLGAFRVAITGAVVSPGLYEVTGASRLSDLVALAGGFRAEAGFRQIRMVRPSKSLAANLSPDMRPEPQVQEIDHLDWLLHAGPDANPALGPGTRIDVPFREDYVEVGGALGGRIGEPMPEGGPIRASRDDLEPATWVRMEWKDGDNVGDLLAFAGGPGEASTGRAVLWEPDGDRRDLDLRNPVDLAEPLEPFTRIEVEHAERWVYVVGSVRVPGRYPYYAGLSAGDYVRSAGGESDTGRGSGWTVTLADGRTFDAGDQSTPVEPGAELRVPERRSVWLSRVLAPVTSAAALVISVVAISR